MTKTKKAPDKDADTDKMDDVLRRMLATPPHPTAAPKPKKSGQAKSRQRKKAV
jgi:hypothetical protein